MIWIKQSSLFFIEALHIRDTIIIFTRFFFSVVAVGKCFLPNPLSFLLCSWIKYLLFPSSPQLILLWIYFIWNFQFANPTFNLSATMFMQSLYQFKLKCVGSQNHRRKHGTSVLQIIIYLSDKMLTFLNTEYLTKRDFVWTSKTDIFPNSR